jgi:hypothetical protein
MKRPIFAILVIGILALFAVEGYFRYGYTSPDLPNWADRYFVTNSLGFRDIERESFDKNSVLVIGNGVTAGWGIADTKDRYTEILAQHLEKSVLNLGVIKTSPERQRYILIQYPLKSPDVIIWQISLDDIEETALKFNQSWTPTLAEPPSWVNGSALLNFLYWRNVEPPTVYNNQTYPEWLYALYDNVVVWEAHAAQMNAFMDVVEKSGARLIVVIFPSLRDSNPVNSVGYVDRVAGVIEQRGYSEILKLYDDFAAKGVSESSISARVPYPNEKFHQHLGDKLYELYFAQP